GMNLRRVHTVIGTAARVNDAAQGHGLAHGQDEVVLLADARCQRVTNRPEATHGPWQVATAPGMRKVTKCQVDLTKPRYKGDEQENGPLGRTVFVEKNGVGAPNAAAGGA
ncbi:MAG: hypothetical protein OEW36_09070, partial [Hylemonella sp.]|nr:hypothetical protein [Hylemonella sp.]